MESDGLDPQEEEECSDEPGLYYIENSKHKKRQPAAGTGTAGKISQISASTPKCIVEVKLRGLSIRTEVDTRVVVSVASERVYRRWIHQYPLERTIIQLRARLPRSSVGVERRCPSPIPIRRARTPATTGDCGGGPTHLVGQKLAGGNEAELEEIIQANLSYDVPRQSVEEVYTQTTQYCL